MIQIKHIFDFHFPYVQSTRYLSNNPSSITNLEKFANYSDSQFLAFLSQIFEMTFFFYRFLKNILDVVHYFNIDRKIHVVKIR